MKLPATSGRGIKNHNKSIKQLSLKDYIFNGNFFMKPATFDSLAPFVIKNILFQSCHILKLI